MTIVEESNMWWEKLTNDEKIQCVISWKKITQSQNKEKDLNEIFQSIHIICLIYNELILQKELYQYMK